MWRSLASNALTLIVVLLVAAGGFVAWTQSKYVGPGPLSEPICLRVEPGSNLTRLSEELAEKDAVSHPWILRLGARYAGREALVKHGSWLVPAESSMSEIVDVLTRGGQSTCGTEIVYRIGVVGQDVQVRELDPTSGRFVSLAEFDPAAAAAPPAAFAERRKRSDTRYRVTFAEGATSWQVLEGLKFVDVLEGVVEEPPPEGALAPDSYEIEAGAQLSELLAEMMARQSRALEAAWRNRAENLPIDNQEEALILASIIEKETGQPEERGAVASVFVNRLRRGMRLQTDPTAIYGITEGRGVLGRGLRQSELQAPTPYNTYVIDGLPPTPIANPGLSSIEAALNPDDTDYLFFVADGTGGHAFAETLSEHNANVAKWRAIESKRANNQ